MGSIFGAGNYYIVTDGIQAILNIASNGNVISAVKLQVNGSPFSEILPGRRMTLLSNVVSPFLSFTFNDNWYLIKIASNLLLIEAA